MVLTEKAAMMQRTCHIFGVPLRLFLAPHIRSAGFHRASRSVYTQEAVFNITLLVCCRAANT